MRERWHYLHLHETSYGMSRAAFEEIARTADLFLNVSGASMFPEQLAPGCVKIFLDTDPGYNQIMLSERFSWSENVERWCASVAAHDRHFTYAENIHGADCIIPKAGFGWKTTRMPIVLELWDKIAQSQPRAGAPWTTVMTWNAFKGKLVYQGVEYKSKGSEFEKIIDLPRRVELPLQVAVGGANAPLERLARHGWSVVDGPEATLTPERYRDFIAGSRGELSTAKHVYVATRSGWFSCRSACYLAAGRPVVVQDTGFSSVIPAADGLLPFNTLDEAAESLREVEADTTSATPPARAPWLRSGRFRQSAPAADRGRGRITGGTRATMRRLRIVLGGPNARRLSGGRRSLELVSPIHARAQGPRAGCLLARAAVRR